jgi:hypothetical protein
MIYLLLSLHSLLNTVLIDPCGQCPHLLGNGWIFGILRTGKGTSDGSKCFLTAVAIAIDGNLLWRKQNLVFICIHAPLSFKLNCWNYGLTRGEFLYRLWLFIDIVLPVVCFVELPSIESTDFYS